MQKEIKSKEERINIEINKEEEEEDENMNENENENNFYSKYDEYYSEQPLLLKESNPKTKFNEIDLNNFYPKLKHIKAKSKNKIPMKENNEYFETNEKEEEYEQIYNDYYIKNVNKKKEAEKIKEKNLQREKEKQREWQEQITIFENIKRNII